jgi:hypothetical protein
VKADVRRAVMAQLRSAARWCELRAGDLEQSRSLDGRIQAATFYYVSVELKRRARALEVIK